MTDKQTPVGHFSIQKIYIKDISFESPEPPTAFSFQHWRPNIDVSLNNHSNLLGKNSYEAILSIAATAKHAEKTAFLVEIQQAGLFSIEGFGDEDQRYLLGSQCMNILLPYAREAISDLTTRGGFPPLILSPVNFDGLYQQHLDAQRQKGTDQEPVKH